MMLVCDGVQATECNARLVQRARTLVERHRTRVRRVIAIVRTAPCSGGRTELLQPPQRCQLCTVSRRQQQAMGMSPQESRDRLRPVLCHDSSLASTCTSAVPSCLYVTDTCHGRQQT